MSYINGLTSVVIIYLIVCICLGIILEWYCNLNKRTVVKDVIVQPFQAVKDIDERIPPRDDFILHPKGAPPQYDNSDEFIRREIETNWKKQYDITTPSYYTKFMHEVIDDNNNNNINDISLVSGVNINDLSNNYVCF